MVTSKVAPPTDQRPLDTNLSLTLMQPLTETNMHTWKMSWRIFLTETIIHICKILGTNFWCILHFNFYKALLVDKWFSKSPIEVNYWSVNRGFAHRGASCICKYLHSVEMSGQIEPSNGVQTHTECFRLVFQTCACVQTEFECFKTGDQLVPTANIIGWGKSPSHVGRTHICSKYLSHKQTPCPNVYSGPP